MAYGEGDTSFQAAGGEAGLRQLVDRFYDLMETLPQASRILHMHPADLTISRDKLARFLCGWLGGPARYNEKYGRIALPVAHQHLHIHAGDRDAWLECMTRAVQEQDWAEDFKSYFLSQIAVPAERVRVVSERRHAAAGHGADQASDTS